jgi:hypothetical protein
MSEHCDPSLPDGWVGGFSTSQPEFAYPTPDLSCLPVLGNLDNIDKLERQLSIEWPEFSWLTELGQDKSRCYVQFAPFISRVGYTNDGRIYSIICPQQGMLIPGIGTLNVEVTVTGQRGWVNENDRTIAAEMGVKGTVWFSLDAHASPIVQTMWKMFGELAGELPFPASKENAIEVETFLTGTPGQPLFPLLKGESDTFPIPEFARHTEAWSVGNLAVQIGAPRKTNSDFIDRFNELVLNLLNISTGNMLLEGNILSWNVWFKEPELVDQEEWANHADFWRHSIDVDHRSPDGEGTKPRFFDGTELNLRGDLLQEAIKKLVDHVTHSLIKKKMAQLAAGA